MAIKFQLRRDTAADWAAANTILDVGEPGIETDTLKMKIGDGETEWTSLEYTAVQPGDNLSKFANDTNYIDLTDLSVTDSGGDGSLSYDNSTGVVTYTGPSASEVRAHFSAGTGITITDGEIATTITQYTDADAQGAFTAGTGIAINSGEISSTITPYTDADAQAAITGGTGVTVTNGEVAIGQNVATSADVVFSQLILKEDGAFSDSIRLFNSGRIELRKPDSSISFSGDDTHRISFNAGQRIQGFGNLPGGSYNIRTSGIGIHSGGNNSSTNFAVHATYGIVHRDTFLTETRRFFIPPQGPFDAQLTITAQAYNTFSFEDASSFDNNTLEWVLDRDVLPNDQWGINITNLPDPNTSGSDEINLMPYVVTATFKIKQGATAYLPYQEIQIDGNPPGTYWENGVYPTQGTSRGWDIITLRIYVSLDYSLDEFNPFTTYEIFASKQSTGTNVHFDN